ncbi:protein draper-like [Ruditapes philippinarum]|uniref:protein draper-like n=1 Tax=Ruditapes philippinarum TaxID=129788 RepID=UPI00295B07C2|nr:protein draper-like [Ruditapes philippinarum]
MCTAGLCEPGWYGQSCSQGCPFRRFGENCSTECNCFNNSTCDKINGICSTGLCDPGWKGQSCSQVCDSGTYGNQCSSSCGHCVDGTTCNNVNGTCFGGCINGYFYNATDTLCKTPCDGIHFGKGCNKTCHCESGIPCKNGNGECPNGECAAGWTSQACDTMCTNGSYGYECKNMCGKCANSLPCNNVNGTCSGGCLDGYILTDHLCKTTCQSGFYGHNCSKPCGHCNKDLACNISSGFCFHGCNAGFNGHLCETNCGNSTFGPNCADPCHCSGNSQCDIFQGNCSNECDIGWAGFNCSIDLNILRRNTTSATALQSKMYSNCSAHRAIDGIDAPVNPSNDANLCAACSVAQSKSSVHVSWWQLDLGSMFLVKFIKIFGRSSKYLEYNFVKSLGSFDTELLYNEKLCY